MQQEPSPTGKTRISDERDLRIVVELTPNPGCPLKEVTADVQDAEVHLHDDGCHCDFVLAGESGTQNHVEHQAVTMDDPEACDCACKVFSEYGCVPHLQEMNTDRTRIATFVPDRDIAWDLLESLGETAEDVELLKATNKSVGGLNDIAELDLSVLSDKQREALEHAVSEGYFGTGSTVSLDELAEDLDISASALSQRLTRGEATLMAQLFR